MSEFCCSASKDFLTGGSLTQAAPRITKPGLPRAGSFSVRDPGLIGQITPGSMWLAGMTTGAVQAAQERG